jgi:hypothetical protein
MISYAAKQLWITTSEKVHKQRRSFLKVLARASLTLLVQS